MFCYWTCWRKPAKTLQALSEYMLEKFLPGAIMAIVSIAVIAWVTRLCVFFIVRIRERDKENPHEHKETMGLPKGAMRTFLTLAFTSLAVIAIFEDSTNIFVDAGDKKWILVELGAIITFYFGNKVFGVIRKLPGEAESY